MMNRARLTVELYGGEDYRIYDETRLIATVYAQRDLEWLLDRDAVLRQHLDTSMRRQEMLSKNVNDGLLEIRQLRTELAAVREQVNLVANFIIDKVPGEPSQNQGACETAIRIIADLQAKLAEAQAREVEMETTWEQSLKPAPNP